LRRAALGIIRILIENKKDIKINNLFINSLNIYSNQDLEFSNDNIINDISNFLIDRFKYYCKEKNLRHDIIEAVTNSFDLNKIFTNFEKAKSLNKVINKPIGEDIVSSYKRASNILNSEIKNINENLSNTTDPGIFKNDFEKNLHKKINEIKRYYSGINNDENYEQSLIILASAKKEVFDFFDNVQVNEENETLRKNRLELINMLCKTFQSFINFQLLKASNE